MPMSMKKKRRIVAAITGSNPVITGLVPASAPAGASDVLTAVNGRNFNPESVVTFDGDPQSTTYVSSTQVTFTVSPIGLTEGMYPVTVVNDEQVSNTATFEITAVMATTTPTSANTKAEIEAWLDANDIDYPPTATKGDLLSLVGDHQ